jgi:alpha-ketoglutarate-dependent taurine dioxygenase
MARDTAAGVFNGTHDAEAMVTLAGELMRVTAHPDSDDRGITTITALSAASERPNAGGFSRRELLAHTDGSGVPTPPALMMLACVLQAPVGGATRLTDGLGVYADLAVSCPASLQALSRPQSVLYGGPGGHLGAIFTPAASLGPDRVAIRLRQDDLGFFSPDVTRWLPQPGAAIERHTVTTTLLPGQGLILDNYRWLHARDTFAGARRLYRLLGSPLPDLCMRPGIPVEQVDV